MFAVLAALTWGVVPIIEKIGLSKIAVWPGLVFRSLGILIGITLILTLKFDVIKGSLFHPPAGWHYLALGGFLASIIGQIFFYNALKVGESSRIVPIAATYPLVTFVIAIFFLKEGITLAKISGLIFVILGVILLK